MGPYSHLSTTPSDGFGPSKLLQTTPSEEMGPSRHLSTTPSDAFGLSKLLQTTLPRALGFPYIFQQSLPRVLGHPGLSKKPFRKLWGLPSEAIPHGKPFRAEGSFERKALGCQMVLRGPEVVQNGTKTDLAAIFQQPLTKVLGLPSNPFRGYGVFQASFNNPFRGSRSSTKSDGLPPFQG